MNPLPYLRKLFDWLMSTPGEDGAEWEIAEPHDPEHITRLQFDDDFRMFERTDK